MFLLAFIIILDVCQVTHARDEADEDDGET